MNPAMLQKQHWFINKPELDGWLDGIAAVRTLVAPTLQGDVLLVRRINTSREIAHSFTRPLLSLKEAFFPPTERLFNIHKTGQQVVLEENYPDWETVVFGVRPCDARGAQLLDCLFLDTNPVDPFYARRRQNTTLIGLACRELGPSCFCSSTGGGPDASSGVDIMLYEVDEGYQVEAVTEKGRFLIPGGEWKEIECSHEQSVGESLDFSGIKWQRIIKDDYWEAISERCLSCRACAYVCPTCRCFAIRDEVLQPGQFERIRCWDSCAGENYRRVAGGHRARPDKGDRLRNRILCKAYYFSEQYNPAGGIACTGCGRCIDACPAGVDIREIFADMENMG